MPWSPPCATVFQPRRRCSLAPAGWCRAERGIIVSGMVNLRGLAERVVVQLLPGRSCGPRAGAKTKPEMWNLVTRQPAASRPTACSRWTPVPYAFRHSYAQRHADAGTAVEVLPDLMAHTTMHSTQVYYRVTGKRTRGGRRCRGRERRGRRT